MSTKAKPKRKKKSEFNPKHKLFAIEYCKDFNATRAYQEIYKCSHATADTSGAALLGNPRVQEEIDRLIDLSLKAGRKTLEKKFVNEIQAIGFSRISDYIDEDGDIDLEKVSKTNPGAVKEYKVTHSEGESGSRTTREFKLHSKDKSLELMGKYLNILTEKVEHSGDVNLIFGKEEDGL
jgi:phage terminase small subunit